MRDVSALFENTKSTWSCSRGSELIKRAWGQCRRISATFSSTSSSITAVSRSRALGSACSWDQVIKVTSRASETGATRDLGASTQTKTGWSTTASTGSPNRSASHTYILNNGTSNVNHKNFAQTSVCRRIRF